MNKNPSPLTAEDLMLERLLTADETAHALRLPSSLLSNAAKRERLLIPHYYINKLVRFKLREMLAWQAQRARKEAPDA
ncbi:DNA-binding protein [Eleftheria terrae]|uniref:DNA-binding protein n=1 Tax=Eleftheria terrae TaxID=1597781 RepID=UPI00263A83B8|nr:DNA-binding protein [Eleftheria terrae]WKB54358.1 DNA-binding protein [Eleftheria terrae]